MVSGALRIYSKGVLLFVEAVEWISCFNMVKCGS